MRAPASWILPGAPWVLHSTPVLGHVTERWIDVQLQSRVHWDARLLGNEIVAGDRRPDWWLASDRPDIRLAYGLMFGADGRSLEWLARILRTTPPGAIHVHIGIYGAAHRRLARRLGVPLVTSFYGADASDLRFVEDRAWRQRYAQLFADGAAFPVEGPALGEKLEALGCPGEKIEVIRLPADAELLSRLPIKRAEGFTVVMAGRFVEKKGFATGIAAFARALHNTPGARLILLGGGPLESDLRRAAASAGIDEQVEFVGRLPFEAFMSRVGSADLALYPSRRARDGDSEGGAPVTLIEAQWLGVPSVVSDHDDLPFAAAPDGSVVLRPDDVGAWAEAIRGLYEDSARRTAMADASRAFAREWNAPVANARAREVMYDRLAQS